MIKKIELVLLVMIISMVLAYMIPEYITTPDVRVSESKVLYTPSHKDDMYDYLVVLQGAWIVKKARTVEDAMNIAVAEAGKKLSPDLDFVDIDVGVVSCPKCGEPFKSVLLVAGMALVGLIFEMKVFNAENEEHAARIAKYEIGKRLQKVPLEVVAVERIN